jgi:hypothetical protein
VGRIVVQGKEGTESDCIGLSVLSNVRQFRSNAHLLKAVISAISCLNIRHSLFPYIAAEFRQT